MDDNMSAKLMELLNNPAAMKELTEVINKFNNGSENTSAPPQSNDDLALKAGQLMNSLGSGSDRRINLLNAIRPYLRDSRASNVDKAIQMLKITKLTDILKNERS